ncbi:hypothetical protein SMACR_04003 [Sordaria macrospora]|uniref:WGS project CABT00000000 data, contig 2.17 n=2 Tax=Sordaria macrospora TaxID=5147 RepID=F7W0K0_SORMK|nr:uncharacterized protein SMAC_04003 [Sordaria macrospora k-hell]KAA8631273.1 hypothetical protein SMACR_04003 [Sordaria macrospora]KAH7633338.1 hypothetical protein B0T09DRAFT_90054 [Sordaria sp. MPI-SDFR-AT-0083]WPJ60256.1 hypothetical protein SMAC4_04003 [Sordaria macrospora]CCC11300.1 unnamed protein product [Sordaria macrospora k-hell]
MDLDIEMDVDDVHDVQDIPQIPEAYTHDIITGEEQEPGEIDDDAHDNVNGSGDNGDSDKTLVPTKVHVRGLDTFNPQEVKDYVSEHCGLTQFDRVEWIDDTNANLVFRSEALAQEVLVALASVAIADPTALPPLEEVPAKGFSGKPDSVLFVRFAVQGDRKVVGAAARSRFYLLHPEYDPEERKRRGEFRDRRYRDRDDGPRGRKNYRNDRNDRRREREEEEGEPFDVNLYDDAPDSTALSKRVTRPGSTRPRSRSRRGSVSSNFSTESNRLRSYSRQNREKELFPDRRRSRSPRQRNRSASPLRDRDSPARMDLDAERDNRYRDAASLRSREKGRAIKERLARTEPLRDRSRDDNTTKELFPSKTNKPKELFPTKVSSTIGSRAVMDQVEEDVGKLASAKLADRITRTTTTTTPAGGFSIRGLATKNISTDQGFRIKGTGTTSTTVKELFPEKFSGTGTNAGKELFVEKLEGRGQRRRRAEDMFY